MIYGLLIYEYAYNYPNLFDSVAKSAEFYPNNMLGWNSGNNGQNTPNWGINNVVPFVVVKSDDWTQEMTDAINNSVTAWNTDNPNNTFSISQVIFQENESQLIRELLGARQAEIIAEFENA